jgi:hypothetical protein
MWQANSTENYQTIKKQTILGECSTITCHQSKNKIDREHSTKNLKMPTWFGLFKAEWVNQPNPNCEVKKKINSGLSFPFFRIS